MKEKSLLIQLVGEMPLFKIIDFLIDNKGMDYTKLDIARGAEISRASLFNYWEEIEKQEKRLEEIRSLQEGDLKSKPYLKWEVGQITNLTNN